MFLLLLIGISIGGCTNLESKNLEVKTFTELYEKELQDVSKIVILDSGLKKTILDRTIIEDFLAEIKEIKFIPEDNQEGKVGGRYSIIIFDEDDYEFMFWLTNINGVHYYTDPDIHRIVHDFYQNLDIQEKFYWY